MNDDINRIIQQMIDHGFIKAYKRWSLHLLYLRSRFKFSLSDNSSPLGLKDILGVFLVFLVGLGISFVAFLCEKIAKLF